MAFFRTFYMNDDSCRHCGGYCGGEDISDPVADMDDAFEDENDVVVLTDTESGEEYAFIMADSFMLDDQEYVVLIDPDEVADEEEMSLFFMKVTTSAEGEEILTALDDDEDDRVFDAYNVLLDDYEDEDFFEDEVED